VETFGCVSEKSYLCRVIEEGGYRITTKTQETMTREDFKTVLDEQEGKCKNAEEWEEYEAAKDLLLTLFDRTYEEAEKAGEC